MKNALVCGGDSFIAGHLVKRLKTGMYTNWPFRKGMELA